MVSDDKHPLSFKNSVEHYRKNIEAEKEFIKQYEVLRERHPKESELRRMYDERIEASQQIVEDDVNALQNTIRKGDERG